MSIDLEKLSPAPWQSTGHELYYGRSPCFHQQISKATDAEFIALARNAFDVMMRRKWHAEFYVGGAWCVVTDDGGILYRFRANGGDGLRITATDPFTALVEADKWYLENVEKVTHERSAAGVVPAGQ